MIYNIIIQSIIA